MQAFEKIRALVCNRCWSHVFTTPEFLYVCTGHAPAHSINNVPMLIYETETEDIRRQALLGCAWCCILETLLKEREEGSGRRIEGRLTVGVEPVEQNGSTPSGRNILRIQLDLDTLGKHPSISRLVSLFTDEGDNAAGLVTARRIQTDVSTQATEGAIKAWLQECARHPSCQTEGDPPLPNRVIEVSPKETSKNPRLVITNGERDKYAALSYCWGKTLNCLLLESNLEQYMLGLPKDLPQTIMDAIDVARACSIPYLWIDALCIVQDSAEDKVSELSHMENIFRLSSVTIVAASAKNASEGFLGYRQDRTAFDIPFRAGPHTYSSVSLLTHPMNVYQDEDEPINERAWTLQEQVLPRRSLVYGSQTLRWRCNAVVRNLGHSFYGNFPDPIRGFASLSTLNTDCSGPTSALRQWMRLVELYSRRDISYRQDKLPAMAALAESLSQYLGPGYYAGLFQHQFLEQLLWYRTKNQPQTDPYRAPSWSWACNDGSVSYGFPFDTEHFHSYHCTLLETNTTLRADSLLYGEVTGGHIVVRGLLRLACLVPATAELFLAQEDGNDVGSPHQRFAKQLARDWLPTGQPMELFGLYDFPRNNAPILVYCLPVLQRSGKKAEPLLKGIIIEKGVLGSPLGLLLVPKGPDAFQRVGIFWGKANWEKTAAYFESAPASEVVIV